MWRSIPSNSPRISRIGCLQHHQLLLPLGHWTIQPMINCGTCACGDAPEFFRQELLLRMKQVEGVQLHSTCKYCIFVSRKRLTCCLISVCIIEHGSHASPSATKLDDLHKLCMTGIPLPKENGMQNTWQPDEGAGLLWKVSEWENCHGFTMIHFCEPNHQFINGWNHLREQVSQRSACIWSLSRMRQAKSSCHWPCTYCMNVHCRRLRSHPRLRQHGNVPNVFSHMLLQPHCSKIHADMPVLEAALDLTSELLESSHQTILRGESTLSKLDLQTLQSTARLWTLDSRLISLISQTSEVSGVYKEKCQPLISCTKAAMAMALTLGHSQHQGSCCHVPSLDSSWYENMNKTWTKHAMPQCHAMPCHAICIICPYAPCTPKSTGFHQASAEGGQCLQLAAADERLVFRSSSGDGGIEESGDVWRCLEYGGDLVMDPETSVHRF